MASMSQKIVLSLNKSIPLRVIPSILYSLASLVTVVIAGEEIIAHILLIF